MAKLTSASIILLGFCAIAVLATNSTTDSAAPVPQTSNSIPLPKVFQNHPVLIRALARKNLTAVVSEPEAVPKASELTQNGPPQTQLTAGAKSFTRGLLNITTGLFRPWVQFNNRLSKTASTLPDLFAAKGALLGTAISTPIQLSAYILNHFAKSINPNAEVNASTNKTTKPELFAVLENGKQSIRQQLYALNRTLAESKLFQKPIQALSDPALSAFAASANRLGRKIQQLGHDMKRTGKSVASMGHNLLELSRRAVRAHGGAQPEKVPETPIPVKVDSEDSVQVTPTTEISTQNGSSSVESTIPEVESFVKKVNSLILNATTEIQSQVVPEVTTAMQNVDLGTTASAQIIPESVPEESDQSEGVVEVQTTPLSTFTDIELEVPESVSESYSTAQSLVVDGQTAVPEQIAVVTEKQVDPESVTPVVEALTTESKEVINQEPSVETVTGKSLDVVSDQTTAAQVEQATSVTDKVIVTEPAEPVVELTTSESVVQESVTSKALEQVITDGPVESEVSSQITDVAGEVQASTSQTSVHEEHVNESTNDDMTASTSANIEAAVTTEKSVQSSESFEETTNESSAVSEHATSNPSEAFEVSKTPEIEEVHPESTNLESAALKPLEIIAAELAQSSTGNAEPMVPTVATDAPVQEKAEVPPATESNLIVNQEPESAPQETSTQVQHIVSDQTTPPSSSIETEAATSVSEVTVSNQSNQTASLESSTSQSIQLEHVTEALSEVTEGKVQEEEEEVAEVTTGPSESTIDETDSAILEPLATARPQVNNSAEPKPEEAHSNTTQIALESRILVNQSTDAPLFQDQDVTTLAATEEVTESVVAEKVVEAVSTEVPSNLEHEAVTSEVELSTESVA